jgi:hypothetical protein
MKSRRLAVLAAIAFFGFLAVETASAFYNPQTGRWLSRDPIAESGGENLFTFVRNNSIVQIDPQGLECGGGNNIFIFWLYYHWWGCGEQDTGVERYKWQENPGRPGKYHVWLEWDGVALDSNGDSWWNPPGSYTVTFPQKRLPVGGLGEAIKLSPCEYDFAKFKSCLSAKGTADNGHWGGKCNNYADGAVSECKAKSKLGR